MDLIALFQSPEDRDRILYGGLLDHDRLEPPFEGRILFDVFPVFIQGRGAHTAQLAPGQGGFQHVRGIHGAFRRPGADDGMDLIDEEDDLPFGRGDLLQNRLEALLELPAVLRAGDQGADIKTDDLLVFEVFRHIAVDDPLGQSLDDRRLADARFPDQDRVVLRPPGEDLHDPPDLLVPPDHGIEGTVFGKLVKIAGISFQCLVFLLRVGIGHPLVAPDLHEDLEYRIFRDSLGAEYLCRRPLFFIGYGHEHMLRADILIREARRLGQGGIEDFVQSRGHIGLPTGHSFDLRNFSQGLSDLCLDTVGIGAELFDDFRDDALRLFQKRDKKMLHIKRLVSLLAGQRLRVLYGFLHLQSEFIESHRDLLRFAS